MEDKVKEFGIPWLEDPTTKQPSVSLTLVLFCTALITAVGLLDIFGKITTMGPFADMYYGAIALYFGRRLNIAGKSYGSDKGDSDK